jgi:hypothetical protein
VIKSTVTKKKVGGITRTWLKVTEIYPVPVRKCKSFSARSTGENDMQHWKKRFFSQRAINTGTFKHPAVSCGKKFKK